MGKRLVKHILHTFYPAVASRFPCVFQYFLGSQEGAFFTHVLPGACRSKNKGFSNEKSILHPKDFTRPVLSSWAGELCHPGDKYFYIAQNATPSKAGKVHPWVTITRVNFVTRVTNIFI